MKARAKATVGLLLISFLLSLPYPVLADSPAPASDYTVTTGGGEYIFVMLAIENDSSLYNQAGWIEQDEVIRNQYSQSGLYPNDGSTMPLWTVDWYAFHVDISSDGEHLVKWGPWPPYDHDNPSNRYPDVLALAFYRNGRELRSYNVKDLIYDFSRLPHSVSHYGWHHASTLDEDAKRLIVSTHNGDYLFDITTGKIISAPSLWVRYRRFLFPFAGLITIIGLVSLRTIRKRGR